MLDGVQGVSLRRCPDRLQLENVVCQNLNVMKKNNNFTRRAFIHSAVITGLGLTLNLGSCTKSSPEPDPVKPNPTPPDPSDEDDDKLKISGVSLPFSIDVSRGMDYMFVGSGFAVGDQILFKPVIGSGLQEVTASVKSADKASSIIVIPEGIASGRYDISVIRGEEKAALGSTSVNVVFNANLPNKVGMTVKGVVYAAGVGVANVVVSDGFEVTTTDTNGVYYLPSEKKGKYVFVSIPGNYEMASVNNNIPSFFGRLAKAPQAVEICDFELTPVNNEKHVVMVLGDMHLANRTDDLRQFRNGFIPDVNASIQAYRNAGNKVYALTLGDMSWDGYWYTSNFALPEYLREIQPMNAQVFHTMGNHDNDPNFVADWDAENKFRDVIGPTYYSFNLGKVHYIVLDDIEYLNTNDRNYNSKIVANQIEWLKKDLAQITDKSTPIIIAMHIQLHSNPSLNGSGQETTGYSLKNGAEFADILKSFSKVHILTGHTHYNYNVETALAPTLMEHNTAAVCATWWWTGRGGYSGNHICKDGAPGGYAVWKMNGKELEWTYKGIGHEENYQFRTYDLNKIHITKDKYAPKYTGADWNTYASDYANANNSNEVLINVWNYDKSWKVEVTENGVPLTVTRVRTRDPLHIVSYEAFRLNDNAVPSSSFVSNLTAHMFKVKASSPTSTLEITVTDRFGKVYKETMLRPKEFGYMMQ